MPTANTCSALPLERAISNLEEGWKQPKTPEHLNKLRSGGILMDYEVASSREAQVQVNVMFDRTLQQIWNELTDYKNWPSLLPNIVASSVVNSGYPKRIRQAAGFQMFGFVPQVHVELLVKEQGDRKIVFEGVEGSFKSFRATITLQECAEGILLTYHVLAELLWPLPKSAIEQGILKVLPRNLKHLRDRLSNRPLPA